MIVVSSGEMGYIYDWCFVKDCDGELVVKSQVSTYIVLVLRVKFLLVQCMNLYRAASFGERQREFSVLH